MLRRTTTGTRYLRYRTECVGIVNFEFLEGLQLREDRKGYRGKVFVLHFKPGDEVWDIVAGEGRLARAWSHMHRSPDLGAHSEC